MKVQQPLSILPLLTLVIGVGNCARSSKDASSSTNQPLAGPVICWGAVERENPLPPTENNLSWIKELLESGGGPVCANQGTKLLCFGNIDTGFAQTRTPTPIRQVEDARSVSFGIGHACAIRSDRTVVCWGRNLVGQLGNGTAPDPNARVALKVSTQGITTVGQLPSGSQSESAVAVTGLRDVIELAAGASHTCARLASGDVFCWGSGVQGQLGDGKRESRDYPTAVTGLKDATGLAASQDWSCAVRRAGAVVCWGTQDAYPRSGNRALVHAIPAPVVGLENAEEVVLRMISASDSGNIGFARIRDGTVRRFGDSPNVLTINGFSNAVQLTSGVHHTCARTSTGNVFCWGSNEYHQLGFDPKESRVDPIEVPRVTQAVAVASGRFFTCALRSEPNQTND